MKYAAKYTNSHALVIGINRYDAAPPLEYAVNDATEVAKLLRENFSFPNENITILLDADATRDNILKSLASFRQSNIDINDRLIFFFAGHGITETGHRGEVGFLVPAGGNPSEISTLIRWDELTRYSDLITPKHVLFIMDACYGGLAITRQLQTGSSRFIDDMLRRRVRQVLTAGKANEPVADSGGPIPGHSVFTGHLIQGLQGAAKADGIITGNSLMAYVYNRVSTDPNSNQTPHYGYFEGDGDMILTEIATSSEAEKAGTHDLLTYPAVLEPNPEGLLDRVGLLKEYLSDTKYRIKTDDLISAELRFVLAEEENSNIDFQKTHPNDELVLERIAFYEKISQNLVKFTICISHWGLEMHENHLFKLVSGLSQRVRQRNGYNTWLDLRWYPTMLIFYAAGLSALAARNYALLHRLFSLQVPGLTESRTRENILSAMGEVFLKERIWDAFKLFPEYKQKYTPISEYLFSHLQPIIDDFLFLKNDYEVTFDTFECLFALEFLHQCVIENPNTQEFYGPLGRFSWKFRTSSRWDNPLQDMHKSANLLKLNWQPLQSGFFSGSLEAFNKVYEGHLKRLSELRWY